jgi:hypothetical protein
MTGGISCNGTQIGSLERVEEIYINVSALRPNNPINATCQFWEYNRSTDIYNVTESIFYFNATNWIIINTTTFQPSNSTGVNKSFDFNVNSTEGQHVVRCMIQYRYDNSSTFCASKGPYYDNDDINFTVAIPLNYTYWNITFTNGTVVSDGANLTRSDSVIAAANWSKNLSSALVRHNGNGTLLNYTINSSLSGTWTNYTLNFSNATEFKTGLINISYIWANDSFNLDNSTSPSHYFYLWGYSKVSEISLNQTTLYNSTPVRAFCKIIDNITSQGINNSNVSFYGNDSFLNWSLTNSTGYANLSFVVNSTSLPSNYTIRCNVTDQPSLYYNASSQNSNSTNITVLNPHEIQVGNFWFDYLGTATNVTNLFTNLTVYANVTDTLAVSGVYVNFSYPNDAIVNLSMSGDDTSAGWHLWNYTFNNSQFPLNATGTYTVRITANNSNRIVNASSYFLTFTVYSNYTLNLTSNYTTYMRGENITAQVWDVNDFPVYTLNWTANLTKYNQTTNTTSYTNADYTYTIADDDPEGNYTLSVNASKYNNTGNNTWYFNVSKNLILTLSTTTALYPGNTLNISVNLYNARGELYNNTVDANITCPDGMHALSFSSGHAYYTCTAPTSYGTGFPIIVNASDQYNNTGENHTTFTTTSAPSYSGGGSSGGFATSKNETVKNCTDKTPYDQCSSKIPYYCSNGTLIQKCSRCGCYNSSYSCQPSGSCTLVREEDFNFNLSTTRLGIKQGEDKEITGVIENTGNTVLELLSFFNASEDCCNISLPPSFELKEKEEKVFTILIHAPLFAVVRDYPNTTISIGTSLFRKDRTIDITVGQSPHYNSLSELENELADIENKIQEVKNSGIDTSSLEAMVEKSKALLQNANSSIASDQIDVLSASLASLTSNNQLVESRLGGLRNQAFLLQNAWLIGLFVVMSFTTMYMVPQVLLPLNKKEKELSELKEEEEALVISRVETEKQYFMRKIDENTFSQLMIGKQDKILKIRAQIRERESERIQIIKSVSPLAMATWFANGIKGIPQKIKNSPKSILNRKNKNNIDSNGKTQ